MKFQKTALMLALSTIAGSSFADLNYNSNYDPQTGAYSQANGVSSTVTGAQLSSTKSQTDQSYDDLIHEQDAFQFTTLHSEFYMKYRIFFNFVL